MPSFFRRAGAEIANFIANAVAPSAVAGQIQQFSQLVDTIAQMFTRDSGGTIYQMTPPGIVGGNTISPASLGAGTTNDYAPTGLRNATLIRQDMSGANTLTGLDATVAGGAGRRITIVNIGATVANQLIIANENAGSAAANRFAMPGAANYALPPNGAVTFEYDGTSQRWRPIGISTTLIPDVVITPASINTSQNNYNPTGLAGATIIYQAIGANVDITGVVAQPGGSYLTIVNTSTGTDSITIPNESGSSTAANRFRNPVGASWYIPASSAMTFIYDTAISRWRPYSFIANAFPISGSSGQPGLTVGNPQENNGISRTGSSIIGIETGGSVRQTWNGSGANPRPVTIPTASYMQQSSQMRWSAVQAIGPLTGTVDNQSISDTTLTARITTSGATTITGATGGAAGRVLTVVNAGPDSIQINSEDAGSTAANRFLLSTANITIAPEGTAQFWYDTTNSRWRRLSGL